MIKLDDRLLAELGLMDLPAEHRRKLLRVMYEELELRVGTALASQMTDRQLDDFEQFINGEDDSGALAWLERELPHYKETVSEEFEKLCGEVSALQGEIGAVSTLYAE
jgi:uncharacterized protein DUF5663